MKLAIVGSTCLGNDPRARKAIEHMLTRVEPTPTKIISGGAVGIDRLAAQIAREWSLPVQEFHPTVFRWGAPGGFRDRNLRIASECDALFRIYCSESTSYGSGWTHDQVLAQGKRAWAFQIYTVHIHPRGV